uniref:Uncharacterized protein n=1 Tax=Parascaris equorum TaxID=6256 RepID=A0A914SHF0_PAREQ
MIKDLEWPQDTLEYKRKKFIEKTERERARNRLRFIGDESSIFNLKKCPQMGASFVDVVPRHVQLWSSLTCLKYLQFHGIGVSGGVLQVRDAISELQESVARSKSVGTFLRAASIAKELVSVPEPELVVQQELAHLDLQSRPVEILDKKEGIHLSASVAVEHQPLLSEDQRSRRLIKPSLIDKERIIANATPTARAMRFSTMLGGVGTAQGRVPASNIINYPWRQEAFGS